MIMIKNNMKYIKDLSQKWDIDFRDIDKSEIESLFQRSAIDYDKIIEIVTKISWDIEKRWDQAIRELTQKFDGVELDNFLVSKKEFDWSESQVSQELQEAISKAYNNITKFHSRQLKSNLVPEQTMSGVYCWQEFRAIDTVWLYIPGWSAPLFSTLLMLAIPAKLAWCKNIVICTPPNKKGQIAPEILFTAKIIGVTQIYKVGWAQAIFWMWYGSDQIPKVDKIFGPGNSFVTAAKMVVSKIVAIDMPAGPSEVLVIADKYANPDFIASDLLSQAEHGPDSQVVLMATDKNIIEKTFLSIQKQLPLLPRKEIAISALTESFVLQVQNIDDAIKYSNQYAPEHLILQVQEPNRYLNQVQNAWSVFCWAYTPESAGDYASGTNHTLPTSWFARSFSGVWVDAFWKWITFQDITSDWLKNIWSTIEIMAEAEWLQAHKNAVSLRLETLN